MQKQRRRDLTGWEHLLRFFVALSHNGWIRLVAKVTSALLVALTVLAIMLIIGFRYVDLQVKGDRIYLSSIEIGRVHPDTRSKKLGTHVIVMATAGFQNSGIYLNKGDKVSLEPDGRVHLALRQVYTFAGRVKELIGDKLSANEYKSYKDVNPLQPFTKEDVFRRDWTAPDGEEIDSRDLNQCLLFQGNSQQKGRWGLLLAQVLEKPGSATADPFQVLEDNNLTSTDLIPVPSQTILEAKRNNGWLTFIINDGVISEKSPSRGCKDYYSALKKASVEMHIQNQKDRIIPERSIPLVWYSDNIGAFRIIVQYADESTR